jgi:hypothetical protein
MTVTSVLPRLHGESDEDFFYRGFYPQPLETCPEDPNEHGEFFAVPALELHSQVSVPDGFKPALSQKILRQVDGKFLLETDDRRELAFALSREYQTKTITVNSTEIIFSFHSDRFLELEATAKSVIETIEHWLGPFPFNQLNIVETAEVQAIGIPGIIAVNQPPQSVFHSLQVKFLNWQHWNLARQMAAQWFAGSTNVRGKLDSWIVSGFVDFLSFQSLRYTDRYNLFNVIFSKFRIASLDYRQAQDLTAAFLQRLKPFSRLTDERMKTANSHDEQSPFLFIRHSLALRQMESFLGTEITKQLVFGFYEKFQHRYFEPVDFYDYILLRSDLIPPNQAHVLALQLKEWWQSDGWADFSLGDLSEEKLPGGKWKTTLEIKHLGEIKLPAKLRIKDKMQKEYWTSISGNQLSEDSTEHVVVTTDSPVTNLSIDPNREIFDSDRFNNSTKIPTLRFFPGTANTLSDSDYTVFWGPYALRRPGEPFTLGLTGALFRYLNSGLYFNLEGAPTSDVGAFSFRHQKNISARALQINTAIEQDYYGSRVTSVAVEREPLLSFGPIITAIAKARQRHLVGIPESRHYTLAGGLKIVPPGYFKVCGFNNSLESEYAPKELSKHFSYERHKAQLSGQCNVGPNISFGARIFRGFIRTDDEVPVTSLFRINDMQEAMIRIDKGQLPLSRSLISASAQLSGPMLLPLSGSTMFLANRLRIQGFYDVGRSFQPEPTADYRAAGLTLKLPIGGDLTGSGSISVTSLSFTTVLYSNNNGEISRRPSFLFDISGDL